MTLVAAVMKARELWPKRWAATMCVWCSEATFREFIKSWCRTLPISEALLEPPLLLGKELKPFLGRDEIEGHGRDDTLLWWVENR